MTAPIRSMAGLVEALRSAQLERELSYELIDALSGLQGGYTAKILGPAQSKRLGPVSTFPLLGALGKALALVDDPEQIALVKGRWKSRKIVGGSARQLRQIAAASMDEAKRQEMPQNIGKNEGFAGEQNRMAILGRKGGLMSGKKRRRKAMRRRELQSKRAHAARLRWSKCRATP